MSSNGNVEMLLELIGIPPSSTGAPCPMIVTGEHFLHLAYVLEEPLESREEVTPMMVAEHTPRRNCALIRFEHAYAHIFGPPGDEAVQGHPLAPLGLRPYSAFEVANSPWIRGVERMNSVHPSHQPEFFAPFRHFIFVFHDSTFECIARGFEVSIHTGSVAGVLRASWPGSETA
jgi:hypothetical protein